MSKNLDHELYEKARKRTKRKKRLYFHFVLFLVGSVLMIVFNKVLKYREDLDWYLWGIVAWAAILLIHFINVFIMNPFFGKDWERSQTELLLAKHQKKVAALEAKLQKKGAFDQEQLDQEQEEELR